MTTNAQSLEWNAVLQSQGGNESPGTSPLPPKIGTDDGISNRLMNILLVIFMLLTVGLAVASGAVADDVKYRLLLRQSMLDIDQLNYDDALPKLMEVFAVDPENANVTYMLGVCHLRGTGNYHKAAFYFEKAAKSVSPTYLTWDLEERSSPVQTLYLLASAYESAGAFEKAAVAYQNFLAFGAEEGAKKLSQRVTAMIQRNLAQCQQQAGVVEQVALRDIP
jgi:tetratricopeptide (TPR) repeat protein